MLLITPRAVFCTGEILLCDKLLKNAFAKLQTQQNSRVCCAIKALNNRRKRKRVNTNSCCKARRILKFNPRSEVKF